jgi:HAD superfamily hydrolase (TIGR01509 family)
MNQPIAPRLPDVDAVIFDLDGVLIDATEWHYVAFNRALALFGYALTRYEHLAAYNGLPTRTKLEMLSVEKGLPRTLHDLVSRLKQQYTQDEILKNCWPSFDKEYMLARLRREGYRLAVCTNSIRSSTELMLQRSGIREYFELVISNEDVSKPKPDPEIYLTGMSRLGVTPQRTIVIEDAPHGVEAALRSGARVFQVAGFDEVDYWRLMAFAGSKGEAHA